MALTQICIIWYKHQVRPRSKAIIYDTLWHSSRNVWWQNHEPTGCLFKHNWHKRSPPLTQNVSIHKVPPSPHLNSFVPSLPCLGLVFFSRVVNELRTFGPSPDIVPITSLLQVTSLCLPLSLLSPSHPGALPNHHSFPSNTSPPQPLPSPKTFDGLEGGDEEREGVRQNTKKGTKNNKRNT